jgi:glycosyltransferase involved in cell wall biosynthesis
VICGRNIICLASNWSDPPTSKHHIMRILAEQNRVIWVNAHALRRPRLSYHDVVSALRRLRGILAGDRAPGRGITVLSPPMVPWPRSARCRRLNAGLIRRQLDRVLSQSPDQPRQLWLFTPELPELAEQCPAEHVIYCCVDEFSGFAGCDPDLIEMLEARTLAACDVVITSSAPLYESRRRQHPNVHLVEHGVDFEHFAAAATTPPHQIPTEVRRLPRPVLGYFGLLSDYLDFELLRAAALSRPDWSFVLIGPATCPLTRLRGLPNLHLIGPRPYALLPAYCAGFDVGLIPFRLNRLVQAVNPIKLREYLAAGLPVVTAPLPQVRQCRHAIYTAKSLEEFIPAVEAALEARRTQPPAVRQALVRNSSWRSRVEQISRIVSGVPGRADKVEEPPAAQAAPALAVATARSEA